MRGSERRTTVLLATATAGSLAAISVWDEFTRDPVTGQAFPSENVMLLAAAVLLAVATSVAVHRGVRVPVAVLVVPLTVGATLMASFGLSLLLGESDGQLALVPLFAVVWTLLLVPFVGTVAGMTLAIGSAVRRRRSLS